MTTEQFTLLLGILSTVVSGGVGIILALIRRDMGRVQVRLLEVEAKRENARADDTNMAMALQLATTIAATLEPVRNSMNDMVSMARQLMDQNAGFVNLFVQKTDEMRDVTTRRDQQLAEHRQTGEQHHRELLDRLDRQQEQLETITKVVQVRDLPPEVRGKIAELVLLASNISADVKELRRFPEPGEAISSPEPESNEVTSAEKS
jgi:hypothetical protein